MPANDRRPLVACRATVYGTLVPAPEDREAAREAAQFVIDLCKYPSSKRVIAEAQEHILEAHAERLTEERGELNIAMTRPQLCEFQRHWRSGRHDR